MRQTLFIIAIAVIFLTCGYFYWEHAVKKLPVNHPIQDMARAVNLNAWEIEAASVVSAKYAVPQRQMYAIAAELRALRSNERSADQDYIADLSRRKGLREDMAAVVIYEYTVYLAALKERP